jgi:xylulokinase
MQPNLYILAIDHGTSGIKSAIVSVSGRVMDFEFQKTDTLYLPGGGVEQNPDQWWQAVITTSTRLMKKGAVNKKNVVAVSVSSTFSSTVAVDKNGSPLMNAVTWMDTRGAPYVKQAMAGFPGFAGYGILKALKWISRTGGAPTLTGKDDIGHLLFIKNKLPAIYEKTWMFLPSKDFLNFKFTGKFAATFDSVQLFWVTDTRDVNNIAYDNKLIAGFGIDKDKLPPLMASTDILGSIADPVADAIGLQRQTKVVAGSPDHQTACIGSGAVRDYEGHLYVGTSSWVQCLVPFKKTDVLHSIASFPTAVPGKYQTVNEQDIAGGVLNFLTGTVLYRHADPAENTASDDPYGAINKAAAGTPAGSNGVIFTPWLNGERTPVDDETIRGCLFNLATTTTRGQIIRAAMEGVAYNNRWSLTYVERFIKRRLNPINIIGGGAQSDTWCQIFADVLDHDIRRVQDPLQANARGAALIASVALGYIGFSDIPDLIAYDTTFCPQPDNRAIYDLLYKEFIRLYRVHKNICKRINRTVEATTP